MKNKYDELEQYFQFYEDQVRDFCVTHQYNFDDYMIEDAINVLGIDVDEDN